jgi:hypothetical protein
MKMNFKYHQIYKKEQQYLRYQNCNSLGATYNKYRVTCTGSSRTYKGVSSRFMNFENAFLDRDQRGAQFYIQVHRGCCARPSQTCWLDLCNTRFLRTNQASHMCAQEVYTYIQQQST